MEPISNHPQNVDLLFRVRYSELVTFEDGMIDCVIHEMQIGAFRNN